MSPQAQIPAKKHCQYGGRMCIGREGASADSLPKTMIISTRKGNGSTRLKRSSSGSTAGSPSMVLRCAGVPLKCRVPRNLPLDNVLRAHGRGVDVSKRSDYQLAVLPTPLSRQSAVNAREHQPLRPLLVYRVPLLSQEARQKIGAPRFQPQPARILPLISPTVSTPVQ